MTARCPGNGVLRWRFLFGFLLVVRAASAVEPTSPRAPTAATRAGGCPLRAARGQDQARGLCRERRLETEDVVLALPRLVLALPRLGMRLVLWPVGKTLDLVDRYALAERVKDVLYNDARTAGVVPKLSVDSFFGASVGVKVFHEDLAGHGEYGSIEARFGGLYDSVTQLDFRADRFGGSRLWLQSLTRYDSQPGLLFQGVGMADTATPSPRADPREASVATRFHEHRLLALLRGGHTWGGPGQRLQLGATGIYNVRDFGPKTAGDEPSIEAVYDTSRIVGFDERLPIVETDLNFVADTRDVEGSTSSGSYVELFGGRARGAGAGDYEFWHYGAEAVAYFNLYKHNRVLIVRAALEAVDGQEQRIPFSELARLGGPRRLRGYPLDRFRDEKALLTTLEYHYPIHQFIGGAVYADAGRVGRNYSELTDVDGWRTGVGVGLIFRSRLKQFFSVDVSYGDGVQVQLTTDPLRAFAKRDTEL